jgi:hypothetical protein
MLAHAVHARTGRRRAMYAGVQAVVNYGAFYCTGPVLTLH